MDNYCQKQLALHTKIAAAFKNFKSKGADMMTKGIAMARLEALERNYSLFLSNHDKILKLDSLDLKHQYFESRLPDLAEDSYLDNKGYFNDFLDKLESQTTASQSVPQESKSSVNVNALLKAAFTHSLPQVDIPKFSGKHADWCNFKDLFRSIIDRRDDLTLAMKLYHLKTLLTGDALDKIESLASQDENYVKAWDLLVTYYENKCRLVDSHLSEFMSVKPMKFDSSGELKRLVKQSLKPLTRLTSLGEPVAQWSSLLVHLTVSRFEANTRKDWEKHLGNSTQAPDWDELKEFMNTQVLTMGAVERGAKSNNRSTAQPNKSSKNDSIVSHITEASDQKSGKAQGACFICQQAHYIAACEQFRTKAVPERRDFVNQSKLCFNCLGGHFVQACKSLKRCLKCKKKHHTFLHASTTGTASQGEASEHSQTTETITPTTHQVTASAAETSQTALASSLIKRTPFAKFARVLLGTARVYVEASNGLRVLVRALIDPCSQVSIASRSLCQRLQLRHRAVHVPIQGVGSCTAATSSETVSFTVKPHFSSPFSCEVQALVLPRISAYVPPTWEGEKQWSHLQGLNLADPDFMEKGHIDLLLGASVHAQIIEGRVIKGKENEPIASLSQLRWFVSGECSSAIYQEFEENISSHCVCAEPINNILERFWTLEEVPKCSPYTADEQACEDHFVSTHSRDTTGLYVVRLPLKTPLESMPFLGDSYSTALHSLQRMESRFQKDQNLKRAYL